MEWMQDPDRCEGSTAVDPLLALADQAETQATPLNAGITQKVFTSSLFHALPRFRIDEPPERQCWIVVDPAWYAILATR